ncbi:MAG: hypothetical protein ACPGCK_05110 [Flavobacteriaceae bacterium]
MTNHTFFCLPTFEFLGNSQCFQNTECIEFTAGSYDYYGHPSAFISVKKQQLLCMAMDQFAQTISEAVEFRFDILCIYKSKNQWQVDHLKNAFYCMH